MNDGQRGKIILYAHPTCPQAGPVRAALKHAKVEFEYINIHEDQAARERVRAINQGYESVPTLVFPDGSTLTEPSSRELAGALATWGYSMPLTARLYANAWWLIIAAGVLLSILTALDVI
jgi:mycoredoxin